MKRVFIFLTILLASALANASILCPSLASKLASMSSQDELSVIVHLRAQADLTQFRPEEKAEIVAELHRVADETQPSFLSRFAGKVQDVGRFWVYNGFVCTATKEVIEKLAKQPEVGLVYENQKIQLLDSHEDRDPGINTLGWNIAKIRADSVWRYRGYTGRGLVIGIILTGVEVTHPALQSKWRSNEGWYDAFSNSSAPHDSHGLGTHLMGTAVGGPPSVGDTIGTAPGATFIAAKAFSASGQGNWATIDSCFQWYASLAGRGLGASVLCNDWGSYSRDTTHWGRIRTLERLGTLSVFGVGAAGPGQGTVAVPGSFPCLIGVGSTDSGDYLFSASGRGPAPSGYPWDSSAAWLDLQWGTRTPLNHIKPDLVAPGVSVRSAWPGGGYLTITGTAPPVGEVAGAVAMLLEKNPLLTASQIWTLLASTCDTFSWGNPYPNQNYGWGRLNCLRAIDATPSGVWQEPSTIIHPPTARIRALPNPFVSYTSVTGHSSDCFVLYDVSGRRVGTYRGDRIGEGLSPGVYFLKLEGGDAKPLRVVKLR